MTTIIINIDDSRNKKFEINCYRNNYEFQADVKLGEKLDFSMTDPESFWFALETTMVNIGIGEGDITEEDIERKYSKGE